MSTDNKNNELKIPLERHGLKLRGYVCMAMYGHSTDKGQFVDSFGAGLSTVEVVGACEVLRVGALTDTLRDPKNAAPASEERKETTETMPAGIEPDPQGEANAVLMVPKFPEVADPFYRLASNTRSAVRALYEKNGTKPFYLTVNAHKKLRHAFRVSNIIETLKLLENRGLVQMDAHHMSETAPKQVQFLFTMPQPRA